MVAALSVMRAIVAIFDFLFICIIDMVAIRLRTAAKSNGLETAFRCSPIVIILFACVSDCKRACVCVCVPSLLEASPCRIDAE